MNALLRDKALNLLSYRAHSRYELSNKLSERTDCSSADLEEVLDWLEDEGFLNDRAYASSVVRMVTRKGYGRGRVLNELSRRGIPKDLWDEALAELPDTTLSLDHHLQKALRGSSSPSDIRKASAAMVRRGFSWSEIRLAIQRLEEESSSASFEE